VHVLVTGAAGFIGSHVVDALIAAGHRVRGLDALATPVHGGPPPYLHPELELVVGDIADPEIVRRCVRGVDAVSHQAAKVGLGQDISDIADYVAVNDLGSAVLLGELAAAGFDGRLVLASSMVVYGEGAYRCAEHGSLRPPPRREQDLRAGRFDPACPLCARPLQAEPVDEDAPTDPRNVYAATKLHQEHLFAAFSRECGVPCTALRYHNVYGPRMPRDTPYAGVAAIFASAVAAGRAPEVFEDGAQRRDFVHVGDVARANVLALTASEPICGALNIATGAPATVAELAAGLCAAAGADAPRPRVTGAWRLGDVRHVFASNRRARERLGFQAAIGLEEGLREFAQAPLRETARSS